MIVPSVMWFVRSLWNFTLLFDFEGLTIIKAHQFASFTGMPHQLPMSGL